MILATEISTAPIRKGGSSLSDEIELELCAILDAARDTKIYEFRTAEPLPEYEAGSHIDLHLRNGLIRSYSLIPSTRSVSDTYAIAVKLDPQSRGGSRHVHDELRIGDFIKASRPRNNFPLHENASHSVFFAGGIGITPIWCMIQRLNRANRSWTLFYSSRTRADMAFLEGLRNDHRAHLHFDNESQGAFLDIQGIVARTPRDRHLYCCGPAPMLRAFEAATTDWPSAQIHTEYFVPKHEPTTTGGFTVCLARSERELFVPRGKTILQVLLEDGIDIDCSCEVGICGTCVQHVLSGIPDHRDSVLTPEQVEKNDQIIVCCSGSKSDRLVLDL